MLQKDHTGLLARLQGKLIEARGSGIISRKTGNLSGPKDTSLDYDPLDVKSCSFNMFQKYGKKKITAKFQSLKCVLIEDTKGFKLPQKFRTFKKRAPGDCKM